MPPHSYDPGIPTLTQRVELPHDDAPASVAPPRQPAAPVGDDDAFPVLTEIAPDPAPPAPVSVAPVSVTPVSMPSVYVAPAPATPVAAGAAQPAMPWTMPASAPFQPADDDAPVVASAEASVLAARLQAEVEQLMRAALADAVTHLQARMDAELPAIVDRVLREVRRG